jgi:hypothetical protein
VPPAVPVEAGARPSFSPQDARLRGAANLPPGQERIDRARTASRHWHHVRSTYSRSTHNGRSHVARRSRSAPPSPPPARQASPIDHLITQLTARPSLTPPAADRPGLSPPPASTR